MKAVVFFFAVFIFLFYSSFVKPVFATPIIIPLSIDTSTPIIGDSFNLTATMSGALSSDNYFIKCRIGADASPLTDGQTYNPQTSRWLDDTGSTGAWVDMPQITTGPDGLWQNSIKCRVKPTANDETKVIYIKACLNSNSSCGNSFQSATSLVVHPIFPTPTPVPTSTPAPTPTNTPTPTSTPTPTLSPTNTPTLTSVPVSAVTTPGTSTPAPRTVPTSDQNIPPNSVLGQNTQNTRSQLAIDAPPDGVAPNEKDPFALGQAKKPDPIFQIVIMLLGAGLIVGCVIFTHRIIKKGELTQNEGE